MATNLTCRTYIGQLSVYIFFHGRWMRSLRSVAMCQPLFGNSLHVMAELFERIGK
jgi:hypothetical protein